MPIIPNKSNMRDWPDMALAVHQAAANLHSQYGDTGIPTNVLMREIERIGGYSKDSVLPSDYCYNLINKSPISFKHRAFVHPGHGRYHYVGPNYDYTGPIMWRPKQGAAQQVGKWIVGVCKLEIDPRQF